MLARCPARTASHSGRRDQDLSRRWEVMAPAAKAENAIASGSTRALEPKNVLYRRGDLINLIQNIFIIVYLYPPAGI